MALPPKWYQFLVCVFASLGSVLYGYDLGVIAEVIASQSFRAKFGKNDNEHGAVVSIFTGGAFFGAMFAGVTNDWLGRKYTILIGALVFCLGGGLQTGAQTIDYLYSGRCLAGVGVGFLVMVVPLYQAELAHPSIRGRVTALQQFMLGIGALAASWISYGTYIGYAEDDNRQWRVSLGLQVVPAGLLALLILFFPESPRWLMDHGKPDVALRTLAQLHSHGDETDAWVRAEFEQIQEAISLEHEHEAKSYFELFTDKSCFRRLFIAMALQASVQMTGVSAIQYYSVTIYGKIGISGDDTLKYQAINSIIALVAQVLTILFIDKTGRRWPLIFGNLGNMVTFIIATALLASFPPGTSGNSSAGWGFIAMTWLYNFCFSCTCGPLSWIIPAEIFDTRTRSKGVAIATMTSFAFNTMIGQVTPLALDAVSWKYYILFIVCNFTNAVFFWAILPETKQRPLEEMNYLFTNAPLFVPTMDMSAVQTHDLERRAEEVERKGSIVRQQEVVYH
ncbi:putative mfs sugar transporter protein [Lasiodiplodia theobromae]|uniref:Putative quinate permease n=1 Tax=Lasiodiplodia theobromae TaxID=45133 RepID=A0A5N5DN89_9PEZI|nr:MFS sugar transporter [Lasiodiplodia theobromae]KAB2579283.1 putative quinate permease [Lasiodiplodia theobromae]KAF4537300.1 MFS sugar transporter [Lasiodiplodia theobromae]KAF9639735.1 putative mfs sugar transporter protein [Lasiodiplodia theobromae]